MCTYLATLLVIILVSVPRASATVSSFVSVMNEPIWLITMFITLFFTLHLDLYYIYFGFIKIFLGMMKKREQNKNKLKYYLKISSKVLIQWF